MSSNVEKELARIESEIHSSQRQIADEWRKKEPDTTLIGLLENRIRQLGARREFLRNR